MLRAQNRVLRCAQLGSPRLLRKTAIWDKMLRQRNSATANYDPGRHYLITCPQQLFSVFRYKIHQLPCEPTITKGTPQPIAGAFY